MHVFLSARRVRPSFRSQVCSGLPGSMLDHSATLAWYSQGVARFLISASCRK